MGRFSSYGKLDSPWSEEGDRYFIGYNSKLHPSQLPEGIVAKSVNKRFRNAKAAPRGGTIMVPGNTHWFSQSGQTKFTGSFVFNNPSALERLIVVPEPTQGISQGTVGIAAYDVNTDNYLTIATPNSEIIPPDTTVWFAQGFDKLIAMVAGMIHGNQNPGNSNPPSFTNVMTWDGNEALNGGRVFKWLELPENTELAIIPPCLWAWPVSDRIAYVPIMFWDGTYLANGYPHWQGNRGDCLILSDTLDYGAYDPVLGNFRINSGQADRIVSVIPYAYDTLVIGMTRSIHLLSNFSVDFNLATQEVLTNYVGICGIRAWIQIGQEIHFMSEKRGVFKLTEVLEKRLMAHPLPISDQIQTDIDRINWAKATANIHSTVAEEIIGLISVETEDNYVYWAVPLDGSSVCNALLVYNTTTSQWETIDQFDIPNFRIDNLLAVHIGGVRRVVAIQNGPPAIVYLLNEGTVDQTLWDVINPAFTDIADMIRTRAYGISPEGGPTGFRNFRRGGVAMETLNPNVKITAIAEGVLEEKVVRESITKDFHKYYPLGKPDFDPLALPDDDSKREDYSTSGTPSSPHYEGQDFSQMPPGSVSDGLIRPMSPVPNPTVVGVVPQMSRERFPIRMVDRSLQLQIENTQGQCTVLATSVESFEAKRNARVAA